MSQALGHGEYRIVPSERTREWDQRARDLLSGSSLSEVLGDGEEFHEYTVERADGRPVFELVRTRAPLGAGEGGLLDDLFGGEGGLIPPVKDVYLFRPPGAEPVFSLEIPRGFSFVYTLADADREEVVARWEKSRGPFGNWHLKLPGEGHVATVKWSRWLRDLHPLAPQGTYVVWGVDGSELGRFKRVGFDGDGLSDAMLSAMEVELSRSEMPADVGIAFAFGIFREARKGGHAHA